MMGMNELNIDIEEELNKKVVEITNESDKFKVTKDVLINAIEELNNLKIEKNGKNR